MRLTRSSRNIEAKLKNEKGKKIQIGDVKVSTQFEIINYLNIIDFTISIILYK